MANPYPIVRLYDSLAAVPNLLWDFNDDTAAAPRQVRRESFSLGIPSLPDNIDAVDPEYGSRTITFIQRFTGAKYDVLSDMTKLARVLLSGDAWLAVQFSAVTKPVSYRVSRATPAAINWDNVAADTGNDIWDIPISLPAEAFAYGPKVTQTAVVVNNDPTGNGSAFTLPDILGDAPTMLRLSLRPSTAFPTNSPPRFMCCLHTGSTARGTASVSIGSFDGLTAGPDTGSGVSDAAYSDGSYRPVTFSSSVFQTRLSGTLSPIVPGRYKVMLRAGSSAAITARVQFQAYTGGPVTAIVSNAAISPQWFDLGNIELPPHRPLWADDIGPTITPDWSLRASRVDTAGGAVSLNLDYIKLIPLDTIDTVESRAMVVDQKFASGTTETIVWDGDTENTWVAVTSTGALFGGAAAAEVRGLYLRATPGMAHSGYLFQKVSPPTVTANSVDSLTRTMTMVVSYYPRYLYLDKN